MSKRKILMLAMSLCMVAILAVGGTLAYFTDEESADNVFTMGNVDIDLEENFDEELADLVPGQDINKDVWVENVGVNDSYVRVHIAFPTIMDDGDPRFNASQNFVHWNFTRDSYADGKWSWNADKDGANYPGNGGNWNFYQATIDGVEYNVYVATYKTALAKGEKTLNAIDKVYLDVSVDAEPTYDADGNLVSTTYSDNKGNTFTLTVEEMENIQIKVYAEGTQTLPFENAYDALNAAFGDPMADGYVAPWNK